MSCSIEEVKAFLTEAEKSRRDWLTIAEASWLEIKRRQPNGALLSMNNNRKKGTYPAWWSIFKIRQPLYFSRVGIPLGKDSSESGNDAIGATAALLFERLVKNLAKTFDFKDVLYSCRDDFLATDFSTCRAYYEREEVKEKAKEYLQVSEDAEGNPVALDSKGQVVENDSVYQDELGTFIYTQKTVDVTNEKICLEPVLYKHVYVDPGITRWHRCKRIAFKLYYSVPEFKEIFGAKSYTELMLAEKEGDESAIKNQTIEVFEYWDCYEKKVYWFTKTSKEFLKPLAQVDYSDEDETRRGLYDLDKFFPCPTPLVRNASTDDFWPTPEYYQIQDVLRDIHSLFTRAMSVARAIRARLMFDNSIDGLEVALAESRDSDVVGVPNLSQALTRAGGNLNNAAQYLDITPLITSLEQIYRALEQRLNVIYKLTGTSDLLQGLITDQTERTFGERQMTEKYALNQIEEAQVKMAEFNRDCFQLLGEMALKNFKRESLDIYMVPQTLPQEHLKYYNQAIELLKQAPGRFRIELETDSTIAINEQYDKAMRVELVNVMTDALQRTAQVAEQQPQLLRLNLHAMKFLVQGFRGSSLFQSEITSAIDAVIEGIEQAAETAEPPFDVEREKLALEQQRLQQSGQIEVAKLQQDAQLKALQLQSQERIESLKLQQEAALANLQSQIDSFKVQSDSVQAQAKTQLDYEKIRAEIATAQEELAIKRDSLIVEMQKAAGEQSIAEFRTMMDQQAAAFDAELKTRQQELDERLGMMQEQEKLLTESRLQQEFELEKLKGRIETMAMVKELTKAPEIPPITVQVAAPERKKTKKRIKIERDADGNPVSFESEDQEG